MKKPAMIKKWIECDKGATSLEYALIITFVFLACVTAFHNYADQVGVMYNYIFVAVDAVM